MRENRTSGSVRGAPGNRRSYRESTLSLAYHQGTLFQSLHARYSGVFCRVSKRTNRQDHPDPAHATFLLDKRAIPTYSGISSSPSGTSAPMLLTDRRAIRRTVAICHIIWRIVPEGEDEILEGRAFIAGLNRRLRGHYNYYGLKGNSRSLHRFYKWAIRCAFKWLNRRGGKRRSFTWKAYVRALKRLGVAVPRITEKRRVHRVLA